MIIELFIFLELIALVFFVAAWYTHQELIWAISLVLFGVLMVSSFNVEFHAYQYSTTLGAYEPIVIHESYTYMMGLNMLFAALSLLFGLFDLFDKIKQHKAESNGEIDEAAKNLF